MQNEIMAELSQQELEVYVIKDETKFQRQLKNYPDAIVFASIDEALSAQKWEEWIRAVMGGGTVGVGILSNTNNEDARRLYLNTLRVNCGFVPVKLEKANVIKALMDILNAAGAKGRRKYIRADTRGETLTTVNAPHNGAYVGGAIRDISVVGFSCVFAQDPELEKNSLLPDIQLKLQSALIKAEAVVFGSRMDGDEKVYVLVFTAKIDPSVRTKIRSYIQKNLQSKLDAELK